MTDVAYHVVEHDGGWAYKLGDVFSETFPTKAAAETVATRVAAVQRVPGETETIEWQDADGRWHEEVEPGSDRPAAYVALSDHDEPARERRKANPSLAPLLAALAIGGLIAILVGSSRSRRPAPR